MILAISRFISPDFRSVAKSTNRPQFVTISFSHFVELARWSLQKGHIKFDEFGCAPIQHVPPVLSIRVGADPNDRVLSNSSYVESVQTDDDKNPESNRTNPTKARATAVPILVLPDGRVLSDSWEIAEYSGLAPVQPTLKKILDEELGPLTRQLAYSFLLQPRNENVFEDMCTKGNHWFFNVLWSLGLRGMTLDKMREIFKPRDAAAVARCKGKLADVAARIEAEYLPADGAGAGSGFIGGASSIGIADIAVASLAGPLVVPPEYAEGKSHEHFQKAMAQDEAFREEVERWRSTKLGRFTLRMFAEHRM
jgi:glutathione S-transferase